MSKFTVGFLITDQHSGVGGLENVLRSIVQGLAQREVDSKLFFLQAPEEPGYLDQFADCHLLPPMIAEPFPPFYPKFLRFQLTKRRFNRKVLQLLSADFDILIVLNISYYLLRSIPAIRKLQQERPNLPIVAWPHGSLTAIEPRIIEKLQKKGLPFTHYFAISQGIQQELQQYFSVSQRDITVTYNPIPFPTHIPARNPTKFLYIGRVSSPGKRVVSLLHLLHQLQGEWSLDIYGSAGNETEEQQFLLTIQQLQLEARVTYHGWVQSPWSQIQEAGVLLLNSTSEGFPLVLAEAMSRGIPCISSDCPTGPNEIIQEGINGWLYPVDQEDQCREILQGIIDHQRPLPSPHQVIESVKQFSEERVMNHFQLTLEELINVTAQ